MRLGPPIPGAPSDQACRAPSPPAPQLCPADPWDGERGSPGEKDQPLCELGNRRLHCVTWGRGLGPAVWEWLGQATKQGGRASCRRRLWYRGDSHLQGSSMWLQEFPQACGSPW